MKNVLIFLAGGAVGAAITAKLVEKYYREAANQEIEDVVNYYQNKVKELENVEKGSEKKKVENGKTEKKAPPKKGNKNKVVDIIKTEEYVSDEEVIPTPIESITGIEIIDPVEYGEEDGFDAKSWMYWADGVLTNEHDEIVDEPESLIGDALKHFGDIEEDSVYVRNRANNTDYEILRSEKEFNV